MHSQSKQLLIAALIGLSMLFSPAAYAQIADGSGGISGGKTPDAGLVTLTKWDYAAKIAAASKKLREAEDMLARAREEGWPEAFIDVAEDNEILARDVLGANEKALAVEKKTDELTAKYVQISDRYRETTTRVEELGLTPSSIALIQKQRKQLSLFELPKRSGIVRRAEVGRVNEDDLNLEDIRDHIASMDDNVIAGYLDHSDVSAVQKDRVRSGMKEVLQAGLALTDDLQAINARYLVILGNESYAERALRIEAKEFIDFINLNLLWARSNQTFGVASATFLDTALARLTNPSKWSALKHDLAHSLVWEWILWVLILAGIVAWVLFSVKRNAYARKVQKRSSASRYGSIVQIFSAIALAIVSAGAIPLFVYVASKLLVRVPGCHEFTMAFALGLQSFASILFLAWLARELLKEEYALDEHFGWSKTVCSAVKRFAFWVMVLIAPIVFFVTTINSALSTPARGSLGRILFMVGLLILSFLMARLFRPKGPLFSNRNGSGFIITFKTIWFALSLLIPLTLLLLAYLGYYRSSVLMEKDLLLTLALIGAAFLLKGLLQSVYMTAVAVKPSASEEGTDALVLDDHHRTKARKLIKTVVLILFLSGLYAIWGQDIPFAKLLNAIVLWTYQAGVEMRATTMGDVVLSILILAFTILIAKNLPGLLEAALFQHARVSVGGRHAITMISQYVVVVVGLTLALNAIGLTWSKFQWLLAALTVGLGFGLQDIVANFASGIIILLERPIRVGDIVTIGSISGQVATIHVRATTITDWDKKEVIVPNKTLLTSNITNWSLSNQLNRIVIPVGVAYGSDARKTEGLLLQAANENALVLDTPAPSVIFTSFGDNSLDFNLRVFVENDSRMRVIHELHMAINDAFNKEGLEIPFPQRDTHVDTPKPIEVKIVE